MNNLPKSKFNFIYTAIGTIILSSIFSGVIALILQIFIGKEFYWIIFFFLFFIFIIYFIIISITSYFKDKQVQENNYQLLELFKQVENLKNENNILKEKNEYLILFAKKEIGNDDDAILLYDLFCIYEDSVENQFKGGILLPHDYLRKFTDQFNFDKKKVWNMYNKLIKLGYIQSEFINEDTGETDKRSFMEFVEKPFKRKIWVKLTDKAKYYFEFCDLVYI